MDDNQNSNIGKKILQAENFDGAVQGEEGGQEHKVWLSQAFWSSLAVSSFSKRLEYKAKINGR